MLVAKQLFDRGIVRIRNIDTLYTHFISSQGFNEEDFSDLLRSEIVYAVSSFDRLIHDLVKFGMIQTFLGNREKTSAYKTFNITLSNLDMIYEASVPPAEYLLEEIIVKKHKYQSFQEPDKINEALSLIWNEQHKWQKIASLMEREMSDLKIELKNIITRRNQIVHEGDFNLMSNTLQVISHDDTVRIVDFIEALGDSIYRLVS